MGTHGGTQQELSNEYQQGRVWMIFKKLCILVLRTKVASALEGLTIYFAFSESWPRLLMGLVLNIDTKDQFQYFYVEGLFCMRGRGGGGAETER